MIGVDQEVIDEDATENESEHQTEGQQDVNNGQEMIGVDQEVIDLTTIVLQDIF